LVCPESSRHLKECLGLDFEAFGNLRFSRGGPLVFLASRGFGLCPAKGGFCRETVSSVIENIKGV
jgi:hypothetical protein